jgi:hypothetical protein
MARKREFGGEITVSSRIVDYLSSGLYESPAACLKELVNNAYDADATQVEIFVKPDADRIIIADNGHGLTRADFQRHFTRISESHKREAGDTTPLGRQKIGKIGIGFIAANEICNEMEILSTKKGSKELLRVTIHFDKMREDLDVRRRRNDDIAKADYSGIVEETARGDHYTRIFLKRVRGEARAILAGAAVTRSNVNLRSLYGLRADTVNNILATHPPASWSEFDEYSRTVLRVALNVPVPYHDHWLPARLSRNLSDIVHRVRDLDFEVDYDGTYLRKPIVLFPPAQQELEGRSFVRRFDYEGDQVAAHGYFYAQHGTIKPEELQGLLIRIREAAVGSYDSTFLDFPATEGPLIQRWISAEIWADDRLEEAMNIDRRTLRVAHPAFVELQAAVHNQLRSVISEARKHLYEAGSAARRQQRADNALSELREVIRRDIEPRDPGAAVSIREILDRGAFNHASALARRMSVPELFERVVDVAAQTLPPKMFRRFIERLTERLNE